MSSSAEGQPAPSRPAPAAGVDRDRRAVRRALAVTAVVAATMSVVLGVGLAPAGARVVAVAVWSGLAAGTVVGAAWGMLGIALDVLAGHRPSRRRLWWTGGLAVAALLTAMVAIGAGAGPAAAAVPGAAGASR